MSPEEQNVTMLDDTDVDSGTANGMNAPYSFGDRDDNEYLDQCLTFFEDLFDSPDPEIGRLFDALDDAGNMDDRMQIEPFVSDISIADDNSLFSAAPGSIMVANENMIGESLETSQPLTNPLSAEVNDLFISPSDLMLNPTTGQLESTFSDMSLSAQDRHFGLEYLPGQQLSTSGVTDQALASHNTEIQSFEDLLMVPHFDHRSY